VDQGNNRQSLGILILLLVSSLRPNLAFAALCFMLAAAIMVSVLHDVLLWAFREGYTHGRADAGKVVAMEIFANWSLYRFAQDRASGSPFFSFHCYVFFVESLKPDLNLVPIRVRDISVGQPLGKLTTTEQASSRPFDLGHGTVDILGVHEPKAEMGDATSQTSRCSVLREGENVVPSRRLRVDEAVPAPVFKEAKDLLVESQCTFSVSNRKIDMREAIRRNHESYTFPVIESSHPMTARIAEPLTHY
jgi:hypothetical protein